MTKLGQKRNKVILLLVSTGLLFSCATEGVVIHHSESASEASSSSSFSSEPSSGSEKHILDNSISIEPQYFVGCCEGLSEKQKSSITALGGTVFFSYFFDKQCERPATISELKGDGSYYVVASTTGNETYGPASAVSNIRAKHSNEPATAAKADIVGYRPCPVCGELPIGESAVMSDQDIDLLSNLYGSEIETASEAAHSVFNRSNGIGFSFGRSSGNSDEFLLRMPKVKYSLYSSVTFNLEVSSGWFNIGLSSDKNTPAQGDRSHATLTVRRLVSGNYTSTFELANDGTEKGSPVSFQSILEDEEIIAGDKGVAIYATKAHDPERFVTLLSINVSQECSHSFGYRAKDVIGESIQSDCIYCGSPAQESGTRLSKPEDIDYSYSQFGASLKRVNGGSYYGGEYMVENGVSGSTNVLSYIPDGEYVVFKLSLPKVNYALYSEVAFPLTVGDAYYGLDFQGVWNETSGIRGSNFSASLTIVNQGTNSLKATLARGATTITKNIESADVFEGSEGISLYLSVASKSAFGVGVPSLTEK